MTQCSRCQSFTMKDQTHAKLALYRCPQMPSWQYFNPFCERDCDKFKQVSDADMPARLAFEGKK